MYSTCVLPLTLDGHCGLIDHNAASQSIRKTNIIDRQAAWHRSTRGRVRAVRALAQSGTNSSAQRRTTSSFNAHRESDSEEGLTLSPVLAGMYGWL